MITGTNTYTGDTIIGTSVRFSSDAALGQGGAVRFAAGVLEPTFDWTTSRDIYPKSNASISSGPFNVALNGRLLGLDGLRKTGSGILTLRDTDEYFGSILVQEGTLAIEGPLANGGSSFGGDMVSTNPGTALSGGAVWERGVSSAGTLAPGVGTGSLSVRDVYLQANSTLALEILSGTDFDRLLVRGTVTIGDLVNLTLTLNYDPVDDVDSFLVIDNDGTDAVQGFGLRQFRYSGNALSELEQFAVGSQEFRISYSGGDGNDVVLYAVPEPATLTLLLAGLPWLLRRCRRSRKTTALERESAAR